MYNHKEIEMQIVLFFWLFNLILILLKDSFFCHSVTKTENVRVVCGFKSDKSPGTDNIGPKLLKILLYDIGLLERLEHICNL